MKKHFPYQLLILSLSLFFIQCEDSIDVKKEYKNQLKYFPDKYGNEKFIAEVQKTGVFITLPECFKSDYSSISINDLNNFYCYEMETYFSLDIINKSDMDYYRNYFTAESINNLSNTKVLLDYITITRANSLIDGVKSIHSNIKTNEGKSMTLGSTKGYSSQYDRELLYQYGVIENGETYYILQAIFSIANTPFLHKDIQEIFKTLRTK